MRKYVPRRGDLLWLDFSPQAGSEQAGHRPAFVVSPETYNRKTGLAVVCPVRSRSKGYPFEVRIPEHSEIEGVVLSDQLKSLDWRTRGAEFILRLPADVVAEVLGKIAVLVRPD